MYKGNDLYEKNEGHNLYASCPTHQAELAEVLINTTNVLDITVSHGRMCVTRSGIVQGVLRKWAALKDSPVPDNSNVITQ